MKIDVKYVLKGIWNEVCRKENRQKVAAVLIALLTVTMIASGVRKIKDWRQVKAMTAEAAAEEIVEAPTATPELTIPPQYIREAEALARVLYGIRDNSVRDQRTYIWCILNRVDNPSREFANTLTEVISKPGQWMFYDPSNPILEEQYQIALQEVTIWHEEHRPVSCDWVFAEWHPDKIVLKKTLDTTSDTWRYPEK
jgi:hypothetical protein